MRARGLEQILLSANYHTHSIYCQGRPARRLSREATKGHHSSYGIIIEADKVLIDAHNAGHRVAFNQAFQELGHRSVRWTPEIFWQLLRSASATPGSLVQTYYNTVGWPTKVAPEEREQLTERIQDKKNEILMTMVDQADIPLRPGAKSFLEDALAGGATIALLASTCSAPSERLVDATLTALGDEIAEQVRVFHCPNESALSRETGESMDDPLAIERTLQAATARRRQQEAQAFMETVNRSKLGEDWREKAAANEPGQLAQRPVGEGMMIDPSLLVALQRFASLNAAWLAACCATLDISLSRFALLGGTNSVLRAAKDAGMVSIAVPSSYSGRGSFPGAHAVMDSFGAGGGVTWSRLSRSIDAGPAGRQSRRQRSR